MNILLTIIILTTALHLTSSAPSDIHQYELSMLNKLHKPWFTPEKHKPQEYPRKGEYPCKRGICRTKVTDCEDCQHAMPLRF